MLTFYTVVVIASIVILAVWGLNKAIPASTTPARELTPEEKAASDARLVALRAQRDEQALVYRLGTKRPAMICPHCQEKGSVRCKAITNKKGVSGGKATAALLTGGVSMLATGLSRKEAATQAHCGSCQSTWQF